jgi:hypothetical protein
VLSVATETAVYSQQTFLRGNNTPGNPTPPSADFSSLVDSNPDTATANPGDNGRQTSDQAAPSHGDDANSAQTANTAQTGGKTPPAQTDTKAPANSNGQSDASATSGSGQQPAADTSTTAGASAAVVKVTTTGTAGQGGSGQGDGKVKPTTKGDATGDGIDPTATQTTPANQPTAVVVAVVTGIASPNAAVTPTATSSAPGAIAAAAVSKVAADVAAAGQQVTTASADVPVVPGQPAAAKIVATDQVQAAVTVPQAADTTAQPASTTPAAAVESATLAEALTAPTLGPVKPDLSSAATAKGGKTASASPDPKAAISQIVQPANVDPQAVQATATGDAKTAIDPNAPKKPGTTSPQAHDAADPTQANTLGGADTPVTPTVHPQASVEPRITQTNTPSAPDLSNTGAAQSAAANVAAAATPAPLATTALNTANLTVMTGPAVPLSGLAVEISANAKAGNSRFEIRLDPPDLGRIDVRLDVDKNGQVTSRLFVEKSETLDLLRRDAPQLQQALQDAGLKTSDSGLQFSLRDQNPQQGQSNANSNSNGNGQNPQRLMIVEDDAAATASAAGRSYGRSLSTAGGVDIRV